MDLLSPLTRFTRWRSRGPVVALASAVLVLTAVLGPVKQAEARVSAYSSETAALARPASAACPSGGGTAFADVPDSNVHGEAIRCVALWDVSRGRTARAYAPARPVTRAQMASFIARMVEHSGGSLPAPQDGAFPDLPAGGTHTRAVESLAALDIVRGKDDGTFVPEGTVTRAQTASLLVRAFEYRTGARLPAGDDAFADDSSSVHESAIDKAAAAGFTTGRGAGRFAPGAAVRRDQMASFVSRVLDRLVVDGLTAPVDPQMQLCYSKNADLSDGRPLPGATVRGEVYVYVTDRC